MRPAFLSALFFVAGASACSFTSDATVTGIPGTYKLATVDGASLPFDLGSTRTVRGQIDLRTDGHYTLSQTDSGAAGATNYASSGTWSVTDNAITFHDDAASLLLGIVLRDSVRVDFHLHNNLYARR
jgi:hypothetical protein